MHISFKKKAKHKLTIPIIMEKANEQALSQSYKDDKP